MESLITEYAIEAPIRWGVLVPKETKSFTLLAGTVPMRGIIRKKGSLLVSLTLSTPWQEKTILDPAVTLTEEYTLLAHEFTDWFKTCDVFEQIFFAHLFLSELEDLVLTF